MEGRVQQPANSSSADATRRQDVNAIYSRIMSNPPTNVYFNKDRTLALAGVGTTCGTLCGHFQWFIFEKTSEGGWMTVPPRKSCSIDA